MSRTTRSMTTVLGSAVVPILALSLPTGQTAKPAAVDGAKLFAARCAPCHGPNGKGGPAYSAPLTGKRSVIELASFLHKSMPPAKGTPEPEATAIAAYMYDAFYSPLAVERNKPARVVLQRLTVKQFRNVVSDLAGPPYPVVPYGAKAGLSASYYKGRNFDEKSREIQRVDPQVNFDFGREAPKGVTDPRFFSVLWHGSVLAPDTGDYEFVVQTDHSARLFVNDDARPLVDATIKSGDQSEYRASVFLLGGRAYRLRLEFTKVSHGVDDTKKKEDKPPEPAYVRLMWKRPKMALEPIPERNLLTDWMPKTFVAETPFPADDRSMGFERGADASKEWDDAVTAAAIETAGSVASNHGVADDAPDRAAKLRAVARSFVERAFGRPLTKSVETVYVDRQFEGVRPEVGLKRCVILAMKSPRFLYRDVSAGARDAYVTASKLSFGLWDTLPDAELLRAAGAGELATPAGIQGQAERMVRDPRAWSKLRDFLFQWLKVDEVPDIVKSQRRFPGFDAQTASDLRTSLELFLESTVWNDKSDYRDLMLSRRQFLNGRLAKLYGASLPEGAPFQPVELDSGTRQGVLTQPYLLARFAYLENSSPIHRGVLIARSLLGRRLNAPPAAFTPLPPSLHPTLTTRERVALQTKPAACNSCHSLINPLGFTLERYDAIGRLRETENGRPVNATGSYKARDGREVTFKDAADLSQYLASSEESHAAFVEKLFMHLTKQPVLAYGGNTLPKLQEEWEKGGYSIRELMVRIMLATTPAPGSAKG